MSRIASYQGKSIRHNSKTNRIRTRALAALSAAAAMVGWSSFVKADTFSNNGGANLSLSGSWVDDSSPTTDNAPPSASDIAQFDSLVGATTSFDLGQASTTWLGLNVTNPGAAITIDDAGAETADSLTLGASGINVGSQSLIINDGVNIGASQTWSVASGQNLTVNGIVTGSASTLTFTGAGNSVLTASNGYTGNVATNATNLTLDFTTAHSPAANILNSGSTLQLGGGSFNVKVGATSASQSVLSTGILPGITTINLTSTGAGVPTLNLGTFAYPATSVGAGIIINGVPTSTSPSNPLTTPTIAGSGTLTYLNPVNLPGTVGPLGVGMPANGANRLVTAASNGTALIGGSAIATVGLYDWAAVTGTVGAYQVVGGTTINNFYFPFGTSTTVQYATYNVVGAASITNQFSGNADIVANTSTHNTDTIDSIRFNTPGTVLVNGVPTLTVSLSSILSAGGILETPNVGASDITFSGTADDLGDTRNASGGAELMLYQNNTLGLMNINTGLGNEHGSNALVQTGAGSVVFGGSISAYLGSTYLNGGMTEIGNNCDLGTLTAPIFIQGGGVMASTSLNMDNGGGTANFRPITLGGVGGTLAAITGSTMNVDGVVSGTGTLEIGLAQLTGTGPNTAHTLAQVGSGTVQLSGINTYVGNTVINQGALKIDTVGVATGTGSITVNSSGGLIGSGSVVGNVVSSGTIIPGDVGVAGNVGTFTINGNLTLNSGSNSVFNTNGATTGPGASEVAIGGTTFTVNPDSGVTLYDPNSLNPLNINGTYDLFSGTSTATAASGNLVVLDPATNAGTHQPLNYTFSDTVNPGYVAVVVSGGPAVAVWINSGSGSWGAPSNWFAGVVPHNPGDIVTLGTLALVPTTITLDAPKYPTLVPNGVYSMGLLTFNNSNGYTVTPGTGGSIAFDQGALTTVATVTDNVGIQALNVPVALNSNTSVTVSRASDTLTFGGTVSGAGSLSITGPGTVNLFASNAYSGVTNINSGTVFVGDGTVAHNSNLGSGGATVTNYGTLVFNNTSSATIFGSLGGTGTITQAGSGTLVLAGAAATFTGPFNINNGNIQLAAENSMGSPGSVTVNGPTLIDLNGNDQTFNNFVDNNQPGKTVIDDVAGGATSTLTINNSGNQTFAGIIQNTSGTVNLVKAGGGILVLANSNSYAGTTTINGGELELTANNSINPASVITSASINGLSLANGITISNPITVNDAANEFETTNGGSATLTGPISVSGGSQFRPGSTNGTITFTNTIQASGDEIFVEGLTILAGTASLTGTATGLNSIGRSTNPAGLTIMNSASFTAAQASGGAGLSAVGFFLGDDDSTSGENSSVLLNLQDNAVMNLGPSAMDLDSDPSASSSSTINLNGGTLSLANFVASEPNGPQLNLNGTDIIATASDLTNGTAYTTVISGTATMFPSLFFPNLSNAGLTANIGTGGFILNNGGFNITIAQQLQSNANPDGGLTVSGTGTLTIANINSFNGNTSITAGELRFSSALNSNQVVGFQNSTVVLSPGTQIDLNGSLVQVGGLSGSGVVDNLGDGTATLVLQNGNGNATSSFAGTIQNSLGAGHTVQVDVENGTFAFTGTNTYTGGTAIHGGILAISSDAAVNYGIDINGPGLYYGGQIQNNGSTGLWIDGGTLQFNNYASTLSLAGNNIGLGAALGTPSSVSGTVNAPNGINYNGPGVLELLGAVTINGSVNLNSGSLGIGSDAAINYGQNGLNFNNNGALQFDNYTSTLSFSNGNISLGAAVGAASTLTGTISSNNINYVGPGKLVLTGSNSLTNFVITGGTLSIGAAKALPPVNNSNNPIAILAQGGTFQLGQGIGPVNFVPASLPLLTAGGAMDITNNTVNIHYAGGGDPLSEIQSYLTAGYHSGAWNGPGIISSSVASLNSGQSALIYSVGYGDGADGINSSIPSGEIEILPTLAGDAKMQGNVVFGDFQLLSQYFGQSNTTWDEGDFTYNGTTNFGDFQLLSQNFGKTASALTSGEVASINSFAAQFGEQYVSTGSGYALVSVPEPASISLLGLAGVSLLARRRRRKSK